MRASGRRKAPVVRGYNVSATSRRGMPARTSPLTLAALATLATLTAFEQPRLLPGGLAQWHHLRVKVRVGGGGGVGVRVRVKVRVGVGVRVRVRARARVKGERWG